MAWVSRWEVPSTSSDRTYTVARDENGNFGCDCAAWRFARGGRHDCKHVMSVRRQLALTRIDAIAKAPAPAAPTSASSGRAQVLPSTKPSLSGALPRKRVRSTPMTTERKELDDFVAALTAKDK